MITDEQIHKVIDVYCEHCTEEIDPFVVRRMFEAYEQSKVRPKSELGRIIEEDAIQVKANFEEAVRKGTLGVARNMP